MEIDVRNRQLGVQINNGFAEIWLWAPRARCISIFVNNRYLSDLSARKFGYWYLKTNGLKHGDVYHFEISSLNRDDEAVRRSDPASLWQQQGVHGYATVFDVNSFSWEDDQWQGLPLADYIIYELHTGTFTPNGDFDAIRKKIEYLKKLGITAIEIMPVGQFPGERNWGYDGVFPFATQNSYGGPEGLQQLVNACHENGIAVILDVIYNHVGPEGSYFDTFGPYFTDRYSTPWGKAINFDDADCDPVRHYFIENALMWFRDFHIDALRLDAVHAIKDFSPHHILSEITQHVEQLSKYTGKPYHLIAELDLNDNKYINPNEQCGYGIQAQWVDEFHHTLRVAAGQTKTGYYEDFNGLADLAKSYKDAYVYDGQYSFHRKKKFGKKALGNPGEQFVVFSQNHDQVGNRMLGERTSQLVSFEMLKLLAGAVFCSPYIPLIFMGEEFGATNPFQFFISHTDPALIEAVREGRRKEFSAFHTAEENPDPQSEHTFLNSKVDWNSLSQPSHKMLLDYYQYLIAIRKSNPVFSNLNRENLQAYPFEKQNCLAIERWQGMQRVLCLMNFSEVDQTIQLQQSLNQYQNILNSAAQNWGGKQDFVNITGDNAIILPAETILIFKNENV
ncbi:malto-oligosyltrehalose trehalohydrolase [Pedobacter sandarakinus]|uniref:malto-oligosyltrehalose trehalohydrolase n=1 Tax=Pedobacter sandarakinus TaxID=353156 RepID=UPI00224709B0|nr:malto-oligosyltrehalose trehalohydrolase [Pedobacter sandarakinus]MCX2575169.1 malto-oligosyltrehalose trehalohydrolase [Pedobacter sandarakinus]